MIESSNTYQRVRSDGMVVSLSLSRADEETERRKKVHGTP